MISGNVFSPEYFQLKEYLETAPRWYFWRFNVGNGDPLFSELFIAARSQANYISLWEKIHQENLFQATEQLSGLPLYLYHFMDDKNAAKKVFIFFLCISLIP